MTRIKSEGSDRIQNGLAHETLTREIIGAFYTVYNELGFGFLEAVYVNALTIELKTRGLDALREAPFDVRYQGHIVGHYRTDLVVDGLVVLEVKAAATVGEAERRQLLNYLRGTGLPVGILFHFGPKPWFKRLAGQGWPRGQRPDQTFQT